MKTRNPADNNKVELKEGLVIKMDIKEAKAGKTLLPKKEIATRKEKSIRI